MYLLHEYFIESSKKFPEHKAILFPDCCVSYKELREVVEVWSGNIENFFSSQSIPFPKRVGILGRKSLPVYAGELSALFLGAAFLPLSPKFPVERLASIIKTALPEVLIVDNAAIPCLLKLIETQEIHPVLIFAPEYEGTLEDIKNIRVITKKDIDHRKKMSCLPKISEEQHAYIMFTSGSTGIPKGVPISHKNVSSFLEHNKDTYKLNEEDNFTQFFEHTFDLSIFDIYMPLALGAAICVPGDLDIVSPKAYLQTHDITVWFSTPSALSMYKDNSILSSEDLPNLKLSLFCGEPLHIDLVNYWFDVCSQTAIENLYGPTELTVSCARYLCRRNGNNANHHGIIAIGQIFPHLNYVMTDEGELCVSGAQCFEGYLDPTAHRNPFYEETKKGSKYYSTGDLVKIDHDGTMLYLGRKDEQVQINGFRVEILEVENALKEILQKDVVVIPWPIENGQCKSLKGFIKNSSTVDEKSILNRLKEKIPYYMIPSNFYRLAEFPLNSSGKIDKQALCHMLTQGHGYSPI